jgi:beta-lactamase superfamily II metal-dependent hydrolase
VRPELAVISVGRVNRYGHPAPLVRRTDRDGTLVIEAARDGSWRVRSGAEGF